MGEANNRRIGELEAMIQSANIELAAMNVLVFFLLGDIIKGSEDPSEYLSRMKRHIDASIATAPDAELTDKLQSALDLKVADLELIANRRANDK
jgi:hypothetical protein